MSLNAIDPHPGGHLLVNWTAPTTPGDQSQRTEFDKRILVQDAAVVVVPVLPHTEYVPVDGTPVADTAGFVGDGDVADGPVLVAGIPAHGRNIPVVPLLSASGVAHNDDFSNPHKHSVPLDHVGRIHPVSSHFQLAQESIEFRRQRVLGGVAVKRVQC